MNLFADIHTLVTRSLWELQEEGVLPDGLDFTSVTVEPPRDTLHGDMATNAAMVLAKPAKMKPHDIAVPLAARLLTDERVDTADVAGPGFLNLRLTTAVWAAVVPAALQAGVDFGRSRMGHGKRINIEYVSANPTGPLHVGHTRGAVFGDTLANLLAFAGFDVTREYYINDGGAQVDVLARSVYLRYLEAHGQDVAFEDGTYPGDYLIPVGQALKEKAGDAYVGAPEADWLTDVREFSTGAMMDLIREDLKALGVEMDLFYSEKSLYNTGQIEAALEALEQKGLICEGVPEPPKSRTPEYWEPRKQTLFRSSEHGDDVDRPIRKSDGSWTYFAPDIAYHYDKIERGFDALIDVFGTDHGGYVKRMKAAVSALSDGQVSLDVKLIQLVRLLKNGKPFKMSKRAGIFVTMRDIVDQAGADATRFHMLTRKNDAPLDFDFALVLDQSKENPVFYVQYAHARICSVVRKASEAGLDVNDRNLQNCDLAHLSDMAEIALIRKVAEWPRLLELAVHHNEPHRIAFYLYDLAGEYHVLHNRGKSRETLRFWQPEDAAASSARIAMIRAVAVVLSAGLAILGINPMEEM
ncbi:MAG: arginine--tRNA ligase [Rhodobacteraceae bacterium]|nr:arginine--tRNA ligase [Paracoccaceae bacterium]